MRQPGWRTPWFAELIRNYGRQHPLVQLEVDLSARRVNLVEEDFDLAPRVTHAHHRGLSPVPSNRPSPWLLLKNFSIGQASRPRSTIWRAATFSRTTQFHPTAIDLELAERASYYPAHALRSSSETFLHLRCPLLALECCFRRSYRDGRSLTILYMRMAFQLRRSPTPSLCLHRLALSHAHPPDGRFTSYHIMRIYLTFNFARHKLERMQTEGNDEVR